MRAQQLCWETGSGWTEDGAFAQPADLVFFFGLRRDLAEGKALEALRSLFPAAHLIGCSTGGHVLGDEVMDDKISALAMQFDKTPLRIARVDTAASANSRACGAALGAQLVAPDLAAIFVLSDGLLINGAQLVAGLADACGPSVRITGGLAGDGADFKQTTVGADEAPRSGQVVAVGFYGSAIQVTTGSAGGWDVFGPKRRVTKSSGNVLFALDDEPALDLYERYLGPEAKDLPGSGLLFPLRIFDPETPEHDIVRTILAIDHETRSMTFAGDIPQDWSAQLMRGNHRSLVEGAANATDQALAKARVPVQAALLVSCIGRRLLMGQRIADEVEAIGAALGQSVPRAGFYSYGELAPHAKSDCCELHNQTMTITTFAEAS